MRGSFFAILLFEVVFSFGSFGAFGSFGSFGLSGHFAGVCQASTVPISPALTESERSSLRYRLENFFNEVDLTVRNHRSEELYVARQTVQALKIYERIPFLPRIEEVKSQLTESAEENSLKIRSFRFLGKTMDTPSPVPTEIFTDQKGFRLTSEQLAETIRFRFSVEGDKNRVRDWVRGWQENIMRLIEPEGGVRTPILQPLGGGRWEIEAWSFRFRAVRFPKFKIRDPLSLLPEWARKNPELFARQEPVLWNLVEKTGETAPQAAAFYGIRERFLLNDARIGFFFIKAGASR